jgi:hypothetical protein
MRKERASCGFDQVAGAGRVACNHPVGLPWAADKGWPGRCPWGAFRGRERRRVGGKLSTPLPRSGLAGRAKPGSILRADGQRSVYRFATRVPAGDGSHNHPAWGEPALGSRRLTTDYPNLLTAGPRQGSGGSGSAPSKPARVTLPLQLPNGGAAAAPGFRNGLRTPRPPARSETQHRRSPHLRADKTRSQPARTDGDRAIRASPPSGEKDPRCAFEP